MNWLARIKTLICRTGLITLIEFCHRCGRRQPLVWWCGEPGLYEDVAGDDVTILCPKCFHTLAEQSGITLCWMPVSRRFNPAAISTIGESK